MFDPMPHAPGLSQGCGNPRGVDCPGVDARSELERLFAGGQIGLGEMAGTAYDTAWVASVPDSEHPDRPAFPQTLEWLRLHQRSEGNWGTELPYYHDRVMSTLAACIVLAEWRPDEIAARQVELGLSSIWRDTLGMEHDPCETIGFELIFPTLLKRARALKFRLPYAYLGRYEGLRAEKLALLPVERLYSRYVTSAFSLEFMGDDADAARLSRANGDLREPNGSIALSPSATSYYIRQTRNRDGFPYLADLVGRTRSAIPTAAPIDIFERAWSLYNLWLIDERYPDWAAPVTGSLLRDWTDAGVGFSRLYSIPDLDETAMALAVLAGAGLDAQALGRFEADDHFACFPHERGASLSAHIHLINALKLADFPDRQRMLDKALAFVRRQRHPSLGVWFDKWHASPYYTTSHAILACAGVAPDLAEDAAAWLLHTQRPDGSWGYLGTGTVEETAYCLQALATRRGQGRTSAQALKSGAAYLRQAVERQNCSYPGLWVSKALYCPTWVVHTAALSALALCENLEGRR